MNTDIHHPPLAYSAFTGIYMGLLLMSAVHGAKLVALGPLQFDGGALTFALTFLVTDIVTEVYGKRAAIRIVLTGLIALLVSFCVTAFAMALPASNAWTLAEAYTSVLGLGSRVMIAAITTFILSQAVDLWLFAKIKQATNGKHLWLRNNASTIVGGGVDSIVFTTIAFYGVFPIAPVILSAWAIRIALSIVDTPLVYLGVWWLKAQHTKNIKRELSPV